MSLETYTGYIKDLVVTNPSSTDPKSQGDDHLRGIKDTLSTQFGSFTVGTALTMTETELNDTVDQQPVLDTHIPTTSGTAHQWTTIPAWVNKVELIFTSVSTTGTSPLLVQLGDSGGIENTGYTGSVVNTGGSTTTSVHPTTGWQLEGASAASIIVSGVLTLSRVFSTNWTYSCVLANLGSAIIFSSAGSKTLTNDLTTINLRTVGGVDTFDSGLLNIHYSK
ncbi:hypothetical protein [uncultured Paraglaciecola sp.]|uniref:hypothetical protein n=1 Tax=uncultured Paraglaciecola sp. TaxID=1765024 RepID=UPI00263405D3|nr:hypothetical protein [uncultured Paraglaciecola sp.]